MKREKVSLPFIGVSVNGNGTGKKSPIDGEGIFLREKTYLSKVCKRA